MTVEPIPDRLETHNRDILGQDADADDQNRNLRLKGKQKKYIHFFISTLNIFSITTK